ncbi:MAG: DUF6090 family protein [Bacteroidota bacterium]
MAKIFRKIRQNLLAENSIRKYLLYAIGEIILVVIGILIALKINTLNQNRERAELQIVLLEQVKFELLEIYEDIWRDTEVLKLGEKAHSRIKKVIYQDEPYVENLCFDFYWLRKDEYVYPTSAAYDRLKKEGLDIIQNDSIRKVLQAIYEGYFPRLSKENAFDPDISSVFNTYYLEGFEPNADTELRFSYALPNDTVANRVYSEEYYEFPTIKDANDNQYTAGDVPLDFEALKKDAKFKMLLQQTRAYRNNKLMLYYQLKMLVKYAVPNIEKELRQAGYP